MMGVSDAPGFSDDDGLRPAEIGELLILSGLNYTAGEIEDETGVSESSVYKYRNRVEDYAKESDDPYGVFVRYFVAYIFDKDFYDNLAAMIHGR